MKPVYPRLHVLLAKDSQLGLVIRHGGPKSVCTLLWDRERDTFSLGQWMRGRINTASCDLSPNGLHFLYSASKFVTKTLETLSWTTVSRTPYLKAVAYYPGWRTGWFLDDRNYCVTGLSDPEDRESVSIGRKEMPLPKQPLYHLRLLRMGWAIVDTRSKFAGKLSFVRAAGSGWELRHFPQGGYELTRGEAAHDVTGWEWADIDNKRLVWTAKGCLWTGKLREDGIRDIRVLHDFNDMKFENRAAPYEGGRPVTLKIVSDSSKRRVPRPKRRKLVRSKVRPGDPDFF